MKNENVLLQKVASVRIHFGRRAGQALSIPPMALASMGVYVFKKSILLRALDVVCASSHG
jgi:ADP-glucose pyrophosphorylase